MLPFTHDAFIDVFRVYNSSIWPAQVVAYLLGATILPLLLRPTLLLDRRHRISSDLRRARGISYPGG